MSHNSNSGSEGIAVIIALAFSAGALWLAISALKWMWNHAIF